MLRRSFHRQQIAKTSTRRAWQKCTLQCSLQFRHVSNAVAAEESDEAKKPGDISNAFVSLSGILKEAEPLDDRYRILKRDLLGNNPQTHQKWTSSWTTLLCTIRSKAQEIKAQGYKYVPVIDYADIHNADFKWQQPQATSLSEKLASFSESYRERGVAVIRNVVPTDEVLALKQDLISYIERNKAHVNGFPADNKQVYELYWTKAQIIARAHPRMRVASQFALSFWHSQRGQEMDDEQTIGGVSSAAVLPVAYCDRLRMRQPGDATFALGPHVDGGSVERWERGGYGLGDEGRGTYKKIWAGEWETHDSWFWPGRIGVESDVYKGVGACSVFRAAQGWLSMSDIQPGEGHLMVNPMLKEALAYWLMRPFFEPVKSMEEAGDAWLSPENWRLERTKTSKVHGATPGFGQEINRVLHPHLLLEDTMVHMPPVEPGDYVIWHCDTIHAVDATHSGNHDSSVLYIPVCPWTVDNLKFAQRQIKAFKTGAPAPDFGGGSGEKGFNGLLDMDDLQTLLDQPGRWTTGIPENIPAMAGQSTAGALHQYVLGKARKSGTVDTMKWNLDT